MVLLSFLFFLFLIVSLVETVSVNDSVTVTPLNISVTPETISQPANPDLMYTLAQVSAVFVAITAGLYTNKIMSISSEKNHNKTRINEFRQEIHERQSDLDQINSEIERLEINRAQFRVGLFVDKLVGDSTRELSLENIKNEFTNWGDGLNYYEEQELENRFDEISEKIKQNMDMTPLARTLTQLPILPPTEFLAEERRQRHEEDTRLSELYGEKNTQERNIEFAQKMLQNTELELKNDIIPNHISLELLFLFGFAILGVVFPLTHTYWEIHVNSIITPNTLALSAFIVGLALTLVYIAFQLNHVMRDSKNVLDGENHHNS